jgi:hypothetical protein
MSNFLTNDIVVLDTLDRFEANQVAAKHSRATYQKEFAKRSGVNVGDTIRIQKPTIEEIRRGWTADWKETDEDYTTFVIPEPIGVDKILTDKEMHLDLSSEGTRIIEGVVSRLEHEIELMAIEAVMLTANFIGAPGTNPSALSTYLNGVARLRDLMVPGDDDILNLVSPQMEVDAVDFLKGLFQADDELNKQYKKGRVKRAAGLMWAASNMTKTHTTGSAAGSLLVNQASALANGATSIALDDATASQTGVVKQNDILTFDGMNACHPITKQDLGWKFPVRATLDADSDGSGNVTVYFEALTGGGLYFSGPKQNVTAQPTNNGTVYLFGHASSYASTTARQGLMWHKDALERVYIKLDDADGAGVEGKTITLDNGMSCRYTRKWDIDLAKWKLRWDVWPAFKLVRPEWALRVQSGT